MGTTAFTGDRLGPVCDRYRSQGDAWACDGLRGLGVASYQYNEDVESRISSYVLGFRSSGAAKKAWEQAMAQTRRALKQWKEQESPNYGYESRTFVAEAATSVVMRRGSVVAIVTAHSANGYRTEGESWTQGRPRNPIKPWARLQLRKIDEALRDA